jgi:hypothetical protein
MQAPEAKEGGLSEPGDQAEDPVLLFPFQFGLKSHYIIGRSLPIFMPQLNDRVRHFSGSRIHETHGLHGAVG